MVDQFHHSPWAWAGFLVLVVVLLFLDLFVLHRKKHEIHIKEALWTSFVWILIALIFNVGIFAFEGAQKGMEFLSAYLLEKSLSVDNLFVFILLFSFFKIQPINQPKILIWGIIGALVFRAILIFLGVALIEQFQWIFYVFGIILIYSSIKIAFQKDENIHPEKNLIVRWVQKLYPVKTDYHGDKFFLVIDGVKYITPLFIVLVAIETTDIIFALDSIPAVFGVTSDPFIVYTSNIFAILGLRALYFALAGVLGLFRYLKYGVSFVLTFIGIKMLIMDFYHLPTWVALTVVIALLAISVLMSVILPKSKEEIEKEELARKVKEGI